LKSRLAVAKLKDLPTGRHRTLQMEDRHKGVRLSPQSRSGRHGAARIQVCICSQFGPYREALARALEADSEFEIVGLAATPTDALSIAARGPDVILVESPFQKGLSTLAAIVKSAPAAKVVALGTVDSDEMVAACAEAGVAGFVTPHETLDDVATTIRRVVRGETVVPARFAAMLLRHVSELAEQLSRVEDLDHLTIREQQILQLIDAGCSDREIADHLYISVSTVKSHVHNILAKSGTSRRGEAAARLLRN
jgi:DNA-binding NarL/FixJ family response regulator